jgi:3-oxoacyl-[acyl-carrier-protein] synthase II
LCQSVFANSTLANYKHLCGEYPTSSAFALWLASNIIDKGTVPTIVADTTIAPKKVLIYNHYQRNYHSLMLLSAC